MGAASVASTISFRRWGTGTASCEPSADAALLERFMRLRSRFRAPATVTSQRPEAAVYRPLPIMPRWLEATQAIIRNSTAMGSIEPADVGRWLSEDVANAATDFLKDCADLLPSEPHIYSSRDGNLVADFVAPRGSLTAIVAPKFVLLFAVADGTSSSQRILTRNGLREALESTVRPLLTKHHGGLDASR